MSTWDAKIKKVAIVGVGLLGGSMGLAMRAAEFAGPIVGVGRRRKSLADALAVGAVDSVTMDPAEGVVDADLVVLATPVGAFEAILRAARPALKRGALVTDVGSTKQEVVRMGERVLGRGGPFVGSHPMAGAETKGPTYARADLFAGATCIITPTAHTPRGSVRRVEAMWRACGMRTLRMTAAAHDKAVARVSHLPHVLAAVLAQMPTDDELQVAATGYRDVTRMAGGNPEMWRDILVTNPKAVAGAMAALSKRLGRLGKLIESGDAKAIEVFLDAAKKRRDRTIGRRFTERRVAAE